MTNEDGPAVRAVSLVKYYLNATWRKYRALPPRGKLALWALAVFYVVLGAFIILVTPSKIGQMLYNLAQQISHLKYGWLVFVALITFISFPPALGHTTSLLLCGFAYGFKGFYLGAASSVFGAGFTFVVLRLLFRRRLRTWSGKNEKWQALEAVVKAKGLPLICLIRMSPFPPWVYSNALFASIEPVQLWQFLFANMFVFPKIAITVFIGSRAAALADGEQRGKMDRATKLINTAVILVGILVGAIASWIIYNQMQRHIRHMEGFSPEVDELAAEAIEDADEEAPLLHSASHNSADRIETGNGSSKRAQSR